MSLFQPKKEKGTSRPERARRPRRRGRPAVESLESMCLLSTTSLMMSAGGMTFPFTDSHGNSVVLRAVGGTGDVLIGEAGNTPGQGDITSLVVTNNSPDFKLIYSSKGGGTVNSVKMGDVIVWGSTPLLGNSIVGTGGTNFVLDGFTSQGGLMPGGSLNATTIDGAVVLPDLPPGASINVSGQAGSPAIAAGAPIVMTGDMAGTINVRSGDWDGGLNISGGVAPTGKINVGSGAMNGAVAVAGGFAGALNTSGSLNGNWTLGGVMGTATMTVGGALPGAMQVNGDFGGKLSVNSSDIAKLNVTGHVLSGAQVVATDGSVGATVGDVQSGATISAYQNVRLTTQAPGSSATGDMAGSIVAGGYADLNVGRDLSGSVVTHDNASGGSSDSITVGRNLSGSVATNGPTSLDVRNDLTGSLNASGGYATITTGGNLAGSVIANDGASISAAGNFSGSLAFYDSATVNVDHDLSGLIQGNTNNSKSPGLQLTVGGNVTSTGDIQVARIANQDGSSGVGFRVDGNFDGTLSAPGAFEPVTSGTATVVGGDVGSGAVIDVASPTLASELDFNGNLDGAVTFLGGLNQDLIVQGDLADLTIAGQVGSAAHNVAIGVGGNLLNTPSLTTGSNFAASSPFRKHNGTFTDGKGRVTGTLTVYGANGITPGSVTQS